VYPLNDSNKYPVLCPNHVGAINHDETIGDPLTDSKVILMSKLVEDWEWPHKVENWGQSCEFLVLGISSLETL
jgi:hypothetical protein